MICVRCQENIPNGEDYNYYGQILCEDCYIGAIEPPRTCDVAAVHCAKISRLSAGQTGTDGLAELQTEIYNYIKLKTKVTKRELLEKFRIAEWELDKQFAVLRHCELVKGRKVGDMVYLVLFASE